MSVSKEELEALNNNFKGEDASKMYASGLLFDTQHNSGARLILASSYVGEQWIIPVNPDFPLIYTGYENAFGKYADSIVKSDENVRVISVISKFPNMPRYIYIYVVQNILTGVYDVIEIKHYESYSETHGYVKPMTIGDAFNVGDIIPEKTILARAPTLDEYDNYRMGVNALAATISLSGVEEDGLVISDEFAKKSQYMQVDENSIPINSNMVMINKYGNKDYYKCFPDIGEEVKDGVLCAYRQINYSFAASETTKIALSDTTESDIAIPGKGKVIDIDIFVNDEEEFVNNPNRTQLMTYWTLLKIYYKNIVNTLGPIVKNPNEKCTYRLKMLYERAQHFLNPDIKFTSNNGVFEFAYINIVTAYTDHLKEGSKLTNGAAAKGVVTHVVPKRMMPRDKYGNVADIVKCPPGIVGRANSSQSYHHELNFISFHIRMKMAEAAKRGLDKQFSILYDYIEIIDKEQADKMKIAFYSVNEYERAEFIADNINNGIRIRLKKDFSVDLYSTIKKLYSKYNIKPDRVRMEFEVPRHGLSLEALANIKNNEKDMLFKNEKGEILNTFMTPFNIDNDMNKLFDDEDGEYVYTNDYVTTDENGEPALVKFNNGKFKHVDHVTDVKLIDIINKNWTDETYVVDFNDKTYTISTMSERPVIIAEEFFYILKHVPEGKLSARYVGSTSPLGIPNKTTKTESNGPISGTPIKYGEMELFNACIRVPPLIVYRHLSIVSKNPEMRSEMCRIQLFENPLEYHNLKYVITEICDDIPAKILYAYNFCLGFEVLDKEEDDIYSAFDDRDYTNEELEAIIRRDKELRSV